jgi:hypothetical protein
MCALALAILGICVVRAAPQQAEPKKEEPKKAEPAPIGPGQTDVEQLEQIYRELLRGHTENLEQVRQLLAQHRLQFQQLNQAMARRRMGMAGAAPPNRGRVVDLQQSEGKSDAPEVESRLGVRLSQPTDTLAEQMDLPRDQGVVLTEVLPNTPADKAGLKSHDVLLELNGKPVPRTLAAAVRMIGDLKANSPVEALILRKGQQQKVKIAGLPEAQPAAVDGGGPEIVPSPPRFGNRQLARPGANNPRMIGMPRLVNPGVVQPGAAANAGAELGGNGVTTTLYRSGDRFTARHQEGSLVITVTGTASGGKSTLSQIQVRDAGASNVYRGLDAVPEAYRDKVKGLIDMAERGNSRVEMRAP